MKLKEQLLNRSSSGNNIMPELYFKRATKNALDEAAAAQGLQPTPSLERMKFQFNNPSLISDP